MKSHHRVLLPLASAAALFAAQSVAAADSLSEKDKAFVKKAAVAGMAEVEQGKLAAQKAADAETRKFAATMVADHGKANDELKSLAKSNGWELPAALDADAEKQVDALGRKSGAEFDAAYAEGMRKDHDQAVALFQDAAAGLENAKLREFAKTTLPTLEHHKKMAHELKPAQR